MPYHVVAAGGNLYSLSITGVATQLALPAGVTLDATRPARMAVLGRYVVVVNAPTRSVFVDPSNVVRPLILQPPLAAPQVSGAAAGGLTGTFNAKYTYGVKDLSSGAVLLESDFSPLSANVAIVTKLLTAAGLSPSTLDAGFVNFKRVYRSTTGPGVLFQWIDVDGNGVQSISDDLPDAGLSLLPAPTELGVAPGMINGSRMTLICQWNGRLWGVGDAPNQIDTVRYSGLNLIYGWPTNYGLDIAPVGADIYGVTGFLPRKNELGIGRRNYLWKVLSAGTKQDGSPAWNVIKVYEGKGIIAPDSAIVINDVGYFLAEDGVYAWDQNGVTCLSDQAGVRAWFAKDGYFNRALFSSAFAKYNKTYNAYELHLAATGSNAIDRWISVDIKSGAFFGPHLTSAFTPSCAGNLLDANATSITMAGGTNGTIYEQNQPAFTDDGAVIVPSWLSKYHDQNNPNTPKVWGMMRLISRVQAAIGACTIYVRCGDLPSSLLTANTPITNTITSDQRIGGERLQRLGVGRFCQLEFTSSAAQGLEIDGYEIPTTELGSAR